MENHGRRAARSMRGSERARARRPVHAGRTGRLRQALNANIGLVVTPAGAVLIDSGATRNTARQLQVAARRVTQQPIRWVINTGTQDHRWLGNGFFADEGAVNIAHRQAEADMQARGGDQLATLNGLLKEDAVGTVARLPTRWIQGPDAALELGGVTFELRHRGGGHTPGDMMVWLPQKDVLFAGDIVYVDRLLAVLPVSNTRQWLAAFEEIERIRPARIVPGHGRVTDLATARRHTRDYLVALRAHMKQAVDRGEDIGDAVRTFDGRPYLHLQVAAELLPGNANRTYLEIERE
jgi:glyoxylase-like metal-dependent hydrolase (beta-lactamase superfamily II)